MESPPISAQLSAGYRFNTAHWDSDRRPITGSWACKASICRGNTEQIKPEEPTHTHNPIGAAVMTLWSVCMHTKVCKSFIVWGQWWGELRYDGMRPNRVFYRCCVCVIVCLSMCVMSVFVCLFCEHMWINISYRCLFWVCVCVCVILLKKSKLKVNFPFYFCFSKMTRNRGSHLVGVQW